MLKVGTIVKLKIPLLGCQIGTLGVCYEIYNHGWGRGASIIFTNGEYDGFSPTEQDEFLVPVRETTFTYNFQNVMKLSQDFSNGVFDEVLGL